MRYRFGHVVLFLVVAAAAPLRAQNAPAVPVTDSVRVVSDSAHGAQPVAATAASSSKAVSGASLVGLRSGVHTPETARADRPNAQATHANLGQARAMMVVGVAGLIAGAIIGGTPGTIIMVGGSVVGLLGLYDYLQ
ncbi:MAG TPA: hypothetical protein VK636_14020 [Gemmatimonadaceae bacterium]|nr:hypothetical protein [Gemmatimonadaceae bacterium]